MLQQADQDPMRMNTLTRECHKVLGERDKKDKDTKIFVIIFYLVYNYHHSNP